MLANVSPARRRLTAAVAGILVLLIGAVGALPAQADRSDPDCYAQDPDNPGEIEYICDDEDDGGNSDDDDGGSNEPSCDLDMIEEKGVHDGAQRWCEGENACWANIPAVTEDEEDAESEPPSDDSIWIYKVCYTPDGTETGDSGWQWYDPPQPTREQMAQVAYGRLQTPTFTLRFNPPERSYVSLDTWWWAEGAGNGEIVGTAALGVVAIGTPSHIEVRPGGPEGPEVITCDWATSKSETCNYTYTHASTNQSATAADGSPGYVAEARIVYTVHFEQDGVPFDVPGLSGTSFPSPWESTIVPVAEVQGIVTED